MTINASTGNSMYASVTEGGLSDGQHSSEVYDQPPVRFDGDDADYDYGVLPSEVNGDRGQHFGEVYEVPVRQDENDTDHNDGALPFQAECDYDYGIIEQRGSGAVSLESEDAKFTESTKVMERKGSHYNGFAADGKIETNPPAQVVEHEERTPLAPAKTFVASTRVLGRKGSVYDGFADDPTDESAGDQDDGYLKVVGTADGVHGDDADGTSEDEI